MTSTPAGRVRGSTKLLTLGAALLVSVGLCEVMARLAFVAPPTPGREPAILYQIKPGVGFIHAPNQQGWIDDGWVTINALGLRGEMPEEQKPAGSIRILAIGDSTTFGWGVNDQDTYVARLQARLARAFPDRAIRAINGGVSGYDLKRDERLFRSFQPTLRPDIVIVGLFWNDLPYEVVTPDGTRLAPEQTSPVSLGDVDVVPTQGAAAGGRPFRIGNMPPTGLTRWLRASRLLFVLRHAWLSFLSPSSAATNEVQWEMALLNGRQSAAIDDAWRDVEGTLANIATFCHDTGVDVGILVLPIRAQVEKAYPNAAYQTRVRDIAARLGMFLIDPLPQFLQARDHTTLFIPYDRMHFSARGNALLADTVFTTLQHRSALAGTLGAQTVRP